MVIAAFAGTGKTYFSKRVENAIDFICMPYKYNLPSGNPEVSGEEAEKCKADFDLELNFEYPYNYVDVIKENIDKYEYLLIPSDSRVLDILQEEEIPYILAYPKATARDEYRERYIKRGNTEAFIDIFIGSWDYFINVFKCDANGLQIELDDDEYLLDKKSEIDETMWHFEQAVHMKIQGV